MVNTDEGRTCMHYPNIIAIDGPAASGKSTVGARLAADLGYICLDTGVMYRAITLIVLQRGIDITNEAAITQLAETVQIDVKPASVEDGRAHDVFVNGQDVTWNVRLQEVNQFVSHVSAYAGVRAAMTVQQRRIAEQGRIVMLGRDIGSVVLPDADLKIYLDASVEERARRRFEEEKSRGKHPCYESVLASLKQRDLIDSTRAIAPLKIAEDAILIDTEAMDVDGVVSKIKEIINHV